MRISDWSSDVCSSDLGPRLRPDIRIATGGEAPVGGREIDTDLILPIAEITIELERQPVSKVLMAGRDDAVLCLSVQQRFGGIGGPHVRPLRSEEHTSELQSLMRISYAVFCLTKKQLKEPN